MTSLAPFLPVTVRNVSAKKVINAHVNALGVDGIVVRKPALVDVPTIHPGASRTVRVRVVCDPTVQPQAELGVQVMRHGLYGTAMPLLVR